MKNGSLDTRASQLINMATFYSSQTKTLGRSFEPAKSSAKQNHYFIYNFKFNSHAIPGDKIKFLKRL